MASFIADLADCVAGVGDEVKIIRALPSAVEKGRRVGRPEERRFVATLSVQPVTQKQLQQLPEGMRNSGTVRVFSDTELLTVSASECRVADRFILDDTTYQIQLVEDWNKTAGYFACFATRVGQ